MGNFHHFWASQGEPSVRRSFGKGVRRAEAKPGECSLRLFEFLAMGDCGHETRNLLREPSATVTLARLVLSPVHHSVPMQIIHHNH